MKKYIFLITLFICACMACSKSSKTAPTDVAPTDLTLVGIIVADNSGNVNFTASATDATSYEYDFGNGIFMTSSTGVLTYKYPSSGTFTVNVIAKSASGKTISKSIQITVSVTLSLVWSEEFDVAGAPDNTKWGYDIGIGSGGWGNNELQYYTSRSQNVAISNGTLKINAIRENYLGSTFTSTRMLTKDKFAFKYGKIEVRAKLPVGVGTWPAIWMLGSNISTAGWPACGEIDIMEHLGRDLNKIYGTLHYPGRSGGNADGNTILISNATTEFHKYTTDWNAATIKFYVDDVLFKTFVNTTAVPFNHNFFIILNVAMGGNFGGAVDASFTNASMEVDYVRVFQ
jgi:beta-glucanase (GH16 family)